MRILLIVVAYLITFNAFANNYVRVVGEGVNIEVAKESGFREAVQIRAGSVVLSERESTLKELLKDNISVYSAGYVRDYKIVNVNVAQGKVFVTMDVLVFDSKLFNQIISTGKTQKDINGNQINASIQTFVNQRNKGDQVLSRVLATYPQNAFIVKQNEVSITTDQYRNTWLRIPYQLSWNYDFVLALNEAMQMFDDPRFGRFTPAPSNVVIMGKNPKDLLLGSSTQYRFNDIIMLDNIKNSITGKKEVRLMLSIIDNDNRTLLKSCSAPMFTNGSSSFYGIGDPKYFVLYGNAVEKGTFQLNIKDHRVLERARLVELSVTSEGNC